LSCFCACLLEGRCEEQIRVGRFRDWLLGEAREYEAGIMAGLPLPA
jgi:hypothetical protein